MRPNIRLAIGEAIAPEIQAPIIRNKVSNINTRRVRCQAIAKQRFSRSHINSASSLPRRGKAGISDDRMLVGFVRRDVDVKVVVEFRVDSPAVFPPTSLPFEVEYIVFKHRVQRSATLAKHLDVVLLAHVVGVV